MKSSTTYSRLARNMEECGHWNVAERFRKARRIEKSKKEKASK